MAENGERLALPIGIDKFRKVRENGFYFVDKSELISDILRNRAEVYLFTRPRRFGKSLNLSMLDAFFNVKYKGNTWFDGLKINGHPEAENHRNAYPVICLNMKDLSVKSYDSFFSGICGMLSAVFLDFEYLSDSEKVSERLKKEYLDIDPLHYSEQKARESIKILCRMLYEHHGVKPIILIDEYDNAINNAFGKESYDEVLEFLSIFYSSALKSNDYMSFAVVTGVMQIAKEGIFSGLNNLKVDNIFDIKFDERYGFTESEVKELCSYYGHPEKFEEAKEWYDGYRFGNADIYNPWSVLNYVSSDFIPKKYWAGTSGNDIIDTLLENADDKTFTDLSALGNGEAVQKPLFQTVAMGDLKNKPNAIFSVLAVAGYLNAVPAEKRDSYFLSIPNREMYSVFYDHIQAFAFRNDEDPYEDFLDALEAGDVKRIQSSIGDILSKKYPFLLLKDEGDYHLILATIVLGREGR